MLLGDSKKAREVAASVSESERKTQWLGYVQSADYYAGKITEQDLLEFAGSLSATRCWAYYSIGIRSLSEGDLGKAKDFFRKTRDTHMVSWWPYHWGSAFAELLGKYDNWPPQDDAKENGSGIGFEETVGAKF